jgi:hypothetical protein
VHQQLEIPSSFPLISNNHSRRQSILGQGDAIDQTKLIWPCLFAFVAQISIAQSEIQLHTVIASVFRFARFRCRFTKEFPSRVSCETMLRKFRCGFVLGSSAKDLERKESISMRQSTSSCGTYRKHKRDTTADSFRAIRNRLLTQPKLLISTSIFPACNRSSVEEDFDSLTGGKNSRNGRVGMGDVDLSLSRQSWRGCKG